MELAFAGLHQLCAPMLDRLERLPGPQRDALGAAFGLSVGERAGSLPGGPGGAEPAVRGGRGSGRSSAWSTTRSGSTGRRRRCSPSWRAGCWPSRWPWCSPCGSRATGWTLAGLPRAGRSEGLSDGDARALLDSAIPGRLDERVRDRIVAETRGNPLALLELPRGLTPAELAGGFGSAGRVRPLASRIEQSFLRQRRGAAGGDPAAAADRGRRADRRRACCCGGRPSGSGSAPTRKRPAEAAGLIEVGPECGSAIRWCARRSTGRRPVGDRQHVHRALADATDPEPDPDRRAWHRAHAAAGRTRTWPPSWSARPAGRRPAAASPRRPRS